MSGPDWPQRSLTPSELRVLKLRATGLTNDEVGLRLNLSIQTIKNHISAAYRKCGSGSLIETFVILGWVTVPGEAPVRPPCGFQAVCIRPLLHRGHHGGFRPAPVSDGEAGS